MPRHLPALDGLRGLAAALVFTFHLSTIFGWGVPVISRGFLGVDLFFVLSGFLLALPWLRAHANGTSYSWSTYARRRLFRIVPAYYASVALLALVRPPLPFGHQLPPITFEYLLGHLAFGTPLLALPNLNGVFWSLGTEMHFYLLLPLLVRAFYGRRWPMGLAVGVAFAVWWRAQVLATGGESSGYLNTVLLPARLDAFAFGIAAAAVWLRLGQYAGSRIPWVFSTAGVALLGPALVGVPPFNDSVAAGTLVAAGFALLLLGAVTGSHVLEVLWSRGPLRRMGIVGYSLYLWHLPLIIVTFNAFGSPNGIAGLVIYGTLVVVVLSVSTVSYWLTERPFLDGGRRTLDFGGTLLRRVAHVARPWETRSAEG